MKRIARTDITTGKTIYVDMPLDHPLMERRLYLDIQVPQETIAVNKDRLLLTLQLKDNHGQTIPQQREVLIRVNQKLYKLQLDKNGTSAVELIASKADQITIQAVEPDGASVTIYAFVPEPTEDEIKRMPVHSGPIIFNG